MLLSLQIQHFAIIDELEVEFGSGLNVMTGETGAGKTIILQALDLLLGARASNDLIRSGETSASVTARFLFKKEMTEVKRLLEEVGIDIDEEIILHRTITTNGKGKISINGIPVPQQFLKSVGAYLVDISSQHEHQLLLDPSHHVTILDQHGNLLNDVSSYQQMFQHYHRLRHELETLQAREKAAKEQYDFLLFQYQELRDAHLKEEEEEQLEAERNRSKHGVKLKVQMQEILQLLGDRETKSSSLLQQAAQFDLTLLPFSETLVRCETEISEVERDLQRYAQQMDVDPDRLETIEDRLHLLRSLKKKHGGSIEACLQKQKRLEEELELVEKGEALTEAKEEEVAL